MAGRCGGRISRPLLYFCAVAVAAVASAPAQAQSVPGWRLHATPHFLIYTVDGTPGARDIEQVKAYLEQMHSEIIAPLGLPASLFVYPLYPSVGRFRTDWSYFAALRQANLVHAWGTTYTGDLRSLSPYTVARAAVSEAFPKAIPLLRWGLGEALGDRAARVDSGGHLKAVMEAGVRIPSLSSLLAPDDFGAALPVAYPTAVSFMGDLLERYGLRRTAGFVERVNYRYYDVGDLFARHFGITLPQAERAWRRRVAAARPLRTIDDLDTYRSATRFVYGMTLAGSLAGRMLMSDGPGVVTEVLSAVAPLRRLDLAAVRQHMDTAQRIAERAERGAHRRELGWWAFVAVLALTPIALAVGTMVWSSIRGWGSARTARKAGAGRKTGE